MKNLLISFLSLILAFSCKTSPKVDLNAEKEALTALENQWTEFFRAKDAEKLTALYAPDGITISKDYQISTNPAEHVKTILNDTSVVYKEYNAGIDKIEISSSGDLASVVGHDATIQKTGNGTEEVKMRYVDVWKKIDGNWKIVTVIATK
jgi:ketosteroid isomerase-like protein